MDDRYIKQAHTTGDRLFRPVPFILCFGTTYVSGQQTTFLSQSLRFITSVSYFLRKENCRFTRFSKTGGISMQVVIGNSVLKLVQGDITQQETEAIVNAANSSLMGGGGVDGAIHRSGGPQILEECKQIVARQGPLPTGQAVITSGGNLKARWVIHTVGPIWRGGNAGEDDLLASAYRSSLQLAVEKNISTISFPSISTGAYRFPLERAAEIALRTVWDFLSTHQKPAEVRFVLFSPGDFAVYQRALAALAAAKGVTVQE